MRRNKFLSATAIILTALIVSAAPASAVPDIDVLVSIAKDARGFKNIFDTTPTAPALRAFQADAADATSRGFRLPQLTSGLSMANQYAADYAKSDAAFAVLVGHNGNGFIRWPDGSSSAISSIGSNGGPRPIILACNSLYDLGDGPGVGLPERLRYKVAQDTASIVIDRLQSYTDPSQLGQAQLQKLVLTSYEQARQQQPMSVQARLGTGAAAVAAAGGGTALYVEYR